MVLLLASLGLLVGILTEADSRIGCNLELAETKTNYSFHLFGEVGILV